MCSLNVSILELYAGVVSVIHCWFIGSSYLRVQMSYRSVGNAVVGVGIYICHIGICHCKYLTTVATLIATV